MTVATWAVLKAAVFEHVWTHDPILTSADCEIVRTQNRPAVTVSVTITIGCLVVQVFGGPGAGPHVLRTAGRPGADFIGIFPPQPGTVRWPPQNARDEIPLT